MEHVRFPLLSREYLVQRVDNTGDDLFNRHPVCKDYVIEALKFHLLTATMPSSSAKCLAAASGMMNLINLVLNLKLSKMNKRFTYFSFLTQLP